MPWRFNDSTWSRIREISGEITSVSPEYLSPGTWKQIDFPEPVGSIPSVLFPASTEPMISSCLGLNVSNPKYCFRIFLMSKPFPPYTGQCRYSFLLIYNYTLFTEHFVVPATIFQYKISISLMKKSGTFLFRIFSFYIFSLTSSFDSL